MSHKSWPNAAAEAQSAPTTIHTSPQGVNSQSVGVGGVRSGPRWTPVVFFSTLAIHISAGLIVGTNGWDDGAITLSFSKTFSEHGLIALTPSSEKVEGFSSPFWFLLMAAINWLHRLDANQIIAASQIMAGLFAATSAALLYKALDRIDDRSSPACLLSIAVMSFGPFLHESFNGMEMNALTAAVLVLFHCISRNRLGWAAFAAAIIPFIRFEATAYVGIAALFMMFTQHRQRAIGIRLGAGVLSGFVAVTTLRLVVFHSLLPNTLLAKRWPPYSADSPGAIASMKFGALVEIITLLEVPLALLIVGFLAQQHNLRRSYRLALRRARSGFIEEPSFGFGIAYMIALWLTNIGIGQNWGYCGRMEASSVPIAIILVTYLLGRFPRISQTNRTPCVAAAALVAVLIVGSNQDGFKRIIDAVRTTVPLSVSPAVLREEGSALDHIRVALGRENIKVLISDVGGTSLYYRELTILDLALLANRELAMTGYTDIDGYVKKTLPEVIEVHSPWSEISNILHGPFFTDNYRPIAIDGMHAYVRSDLFDRVERRTN